MVQQKPTKNKYSKVEKRICGGLLLIIIMTCIVSIVTWWASLIDKLSIAREIGGILFFTILLLMVLLQFSHPVRSILEKLIFITEDKK